MKKKVPLASSVLYGILGIISILLILNVGSYLHLLQYNLDQASFFFRKTNFDTERNLPSIFSGLLHFTASLFLGMVGISRLSIKKSKLMWWVLSLIFLFLSLDEILVLHEKVRGNVETIEDQGIFFYKWVLGYGIGLLILCGFLAKSLWNLPRRTFYLFIIAGSVFVSGALVLESIAGNIVFQRQLEPEVVKTTPIIFVLATLEELLEMLGVTIFIYAILDFLHLYRVPKLKKELINK